MRIHYLGAARTTTGSMYLLEVNRQRILLECGLYQGRREDAVERNRSFTFDPATIDCAVVSHAHIDHVGNFPNLCKKGFDGNIYSTFATRDLAAIMLADSAEVQRADAEYVTQQRAKKGLPAIEPLYSGIDAEKAIRQFVAFNYDRPLPLGDGVTLTFKDAGHILGSAQVLLDIRESDRKYRFLFSGDIGRPNQDILRDSAPIENVDFLQIESTYGDREHLDLANSLDELERLVGGALKRGGKVIIPAFSVGRTQQLVFEFHKLIDAGRLPVVPMFVDSPLSVNATEVFRLHPECFDEETYKYLHEHGNPFGFANLTYIRDVGQSKTLNDLKVPCVIISASGMAEAGRIRHHLANHAGNPDNLILFVGYCAEQTLGAQILAGRNPVNIHGTPITIRAQVARIDSFSGHAGYSELLTYFRRLTGDLKKITVIHGDEIPALNFGEALRRERPTAEVIVPTPGQVVDF